MAKSRASEVDVPRLCEAIYKARLTLKRYREEMLSSVQQMVGRHYSDEGTRETVPLNLIKSYVSIVGRKLISQNPRVLLSTWNKDQKAAVNAMQSWANRELENMNFAKTMGRVTKAALFSVGFTKVCLATPADAAHRNWNLEVGQPFADEILLDDIVFDVHARSFEEVGYIGHSYRVPLDVVKDSKLYNKSRLKLEAQPDPQFNREGDMKIGVLGRAFYSNEEEYEDFVTLWEIYYPRKRLVITLADDFMNGPLGGANEEPLRVVDWIGPDSGPIEVLGYEDVPGTAMPSAPLQNLRDLHDPANNILRKLIRQSQRQKRQLLVGGGSTEDAQRITDGNDGDAIRLDNPGATEEKDWGGPNEQLFAMFMKLKEEFSWEAGNLDSLGGLSPQAKTLGQDQMLQQNSSAIIQSMQEQVVDHARKVIKRLCWYWWNHPTKVMQTELAVPGLHGFNQVRSVHPAGHQGPGLKRSGRLADLEVQVDPYSMQSQTPQSQMASLTQVLTQIIIPLAPVLQAQGITPDMNFFLTLVGKYLNLPDLPQIVSVTEPPQQDSQQPPGAGDQPTSPGNTTRTYNRISQSNQTEGNKNAESMMKMMGQMGPQRNGTVNR